MRRVCRVSCLVAATLWLGTVVGRAQELGAEISADGRILAPDALWALPQCTPPGIFADQPCLPPPAPNTFTNFVEQIFNDQVTAGCGVDGQGKLLYCPNSPVTRKQMAVFLEVAMRGTAVWTPGIPKGGIMMWSGTIAAIPAGWGLCDGGWYDPTDPSPGQPGQTTSDATHTVPTPDLTDRFILSVTSSLEDPGSTGGANSITLSAANLPSHSHSGSTGGASADHTHSGSTSTSSHQHNIFGGPWGIVVDSGSPGQTWGGSNVAMSNGVAQAWQTDNLGHEHYFTTGGVSADHNHSFTTDSTGSGTAVDTRPSFFKLAYIMKL
jgi:hypothetical protein